MPKYRVLEKSYIGNSIREVGAVVEYDGKPGKALELIPEAEPAADKAEGEKKGKGKKAEAEKAEGEAGAA